MTATESLQKVMHLLPRDVRARWYKQQILIVRTLRNDLSRRMGVKSFDDNYSMIEIPEPDEVVSETIVRIVNRHNHRYVWDGKTPKTFNKFFASCLKTTVNSLRSKERGHRFGVEKLERTIGTFSLTPYELGIRPDETIAQRQSKKVLAAAIARTRISGATVAYVDRVHLYAEEKFTTDEIAKDLGVRPTTVASIRKRVRSALKDAKKP